jgi:hypothetical protein
MVVIGREVLEDSEDAMGRKVNNSKSLYKKSTNLESIMDATIHQGHVEGYITRASSPLVFSNLANQYLARSSSRRLLRHIARSERSDLRVLGRARVGRPLRTAGRWRRDLSADGFCLHDMMMAAFA